jgi:hypothetical protein
MEAPSYFLFVLLLTGFVTGQRSRNRILRDRLYLETLTNQSKTTNENQTISSVIVRPLDTTTAPPSPLTEGMDYEGSGFLDVFWKLTARAVTPSISVPTKTTTPDATTPSSSTTPSPRLLTTSSESPDFDQYDRFYYDVTLPLPPGGARQAQQLGALRSRQRHCRLLPARRLLAQRLLSLRSGGLRPGQPLRLRPAPPLTVKTRSTSPVTPASTTLRMTMTTVRTTSRRTTIRTTVPTIRTTERPSTTTPRSTTPRTTTTVSSSTVTSSTSNLSTDPTTARLTQTTAVFASTNTTFPSTTPYAPTDDAYGVNITLMRNETGVNTSTDGYKRLERFIDTVAFTTLQLLFGEDNDTFGGSDNETDGVAYGSTLYAGGNINWQSRIRTWFETEFIGKLNYIFKMFCLE